MTDEGKASEQHVDDQSQAESAGERSASEKPQNAGRKETNAPDTAEMLGKVLGGFSNMHANGAQGVSPQITDALTQALLAILGAGPSMAAFDSLLSVQAANGMMYYNAVAHQQKANLLGMAMTAKCVRYMLDPKVEDLDDWASDEK